MILNKKYTELLSKDNNLYIKSNITYHTKRNHKNSFQAKNTNATAILIEYFPPLKLKYTLTREKLQFREPRRGR